MLHWSVDWLFFDIGNTLVDETPCLEARIDETVRASQGTDWQISRAELAARVTQAAASSGTPYQAVMTQIGVGYRAPWRHELSRPYPETVTLLASLASRFRLGVIANQTPGLHYRLAEWGVEGFFEVVASSGEVGVEKPDPRLFTYALEQAGCRPQRSVMIGDRLDNDIWPAAELGMRTIWVRQGVGGLMSMSGQRPIPDATVGRVAEVATVLACDCPNRA